MSQNDQSPDATKDVKNDDVKNNATDPDADAGTWDAADSVSGELRESSDIPEQGVSGSFDEGVAVDPVDEVGQG